MGRIWFTSQHLIFQVSIWISSFILFRFTLLSFPSHPTCAQHVLLGAFVSVHYRRSTFAFVITLQRIFSLNYCLKHFNTTSSKTSSLQTLYCYNMPLLHSVLLTQVLLSTFPFFIRRLYRTHNITILFSTTTFSHFNGAKLVYQFLILRIFIEMLPIAYKNRTKFNQLLTKIFQRFSAFESPWCALHIIHAGLRPVHRQWYDDRGFKRSHVPQHASTHQPIVSIARITMLSTTNTLHVIVNRLRAASTQSHHRRWRPIVSIEWSATREDTSTDDVALSALSVTFILLSSFTTLDSKRQKECYRQRTQRHNLGLIHEVWSYFFYAYRYKKVGIMRPTTFVKVVEF